jgi:hypothetical protein
MSGEIRIKATAQTLVVSGSGFLLLFRGSFVCYDRYIINFLEIKWNQKPMYHSGLFYHWEFC